MPKDNILRLLELAVHQISDKFHDHYIIVEVKSEKCGVNSTIHFPSKISQAIAPWFELLHEGIGLKSCFVTLKHNF